MVETAVLLVDEVVPRQPLRQWVLSVPFPLRFLFATEPEALSAVLGIVYRAIAQVMTGTESRMPQKRWTHHESSSLTHETCFRRRRRSCHAGRYLPEFHGNR